MQMIRYFLIFFTLFSLMDYVIYARFINTAQMKKMKEDNKMNQFERIANLNRADEFYRAEESIKMLNKAVEEMPKPKNQFSSTKSARKSLSEIKSLMNWLGRIH